MGQELELLFMAAIELSANAVLELPTKPEHNRHDKSITRKKKDIDLSSDFAIPALPIPQRSFYNS
jgi:hypothetical protein